MEEAPPRLVWGKSARITADSITRRLSVSTSSDAGSSAIANSCSAWLACLPQSHRAAEAAPGIERIREGGHAEPRECWCSGAFRIKRAKRGKAIVRRSDKSLSDKEFTSYFRDSRNAEADAPGIPLVRPGTVLAHARQFRFVAVVLL